MIKNAHLVEAFERELARREKPNHAANLILFDAMLTEARAAGALPFPDALENLAFKITLAKALNV